MSEMECGCGPGNERVSVFGLVQAVMWLKLTLTSGSWKQVGWWEYSFEADTFSLHSLSIAVI